MEKPEFDPHDPFDLVGTIVPMEEGRDGLDEMARTIIQEYITIGWGEQVIFHMFSKEKYRGPHSIYKQRGEEYIKKLIEEEIAAHQSLVRRLFGAGTSKEA